MRSIAVLFMLLFLARGAAAQIHYWVDENGIQHYSCDPPPDENAVKSYQVFDTIDEAPDRISSPAKSSDPNNATQNGYPDVFLYTTSWCGYCKQAKAWLDAHHVPYTNYDIEKFALAREEYKRLGGKGVPLIRVGDNLMRGWSEATMKRYLGMD